MDDKDAFTNAEKLSEHLASQYDLGAVASPSLGGTGVVGINFRRSIDSQDYAESRRRGKLKKVNTIS